MFILGNLNIDSGDNFSGRSQCYPSLAVLLSSSPPIRKLDEGANLILARDTGFIAIYTETEHYHKE